MFQVYTGWFSNYPYADRTYGVSEHHTHASIWAPNQYRRGPSERPFWQAEPRQVKQPLLKAVVSLNTTSLIAGWSKKMKTNTNSTHALFFVILGLTCYMTALRSCTVGILLTRKRLKMLGHSSKNSIRTGSRSMALKTNGGYGKIFYNKSTSVWNVCIPTWRGDKVVSAGKTVKRIKTC